MNKLLLAVAALLALAYALMAGDWAFAEAPRAAHVAIKTGSVALLALLALIAGGPRLLATALAFGALGDALLALGSREGFAAGAGAFLIGHVLYISLFLRHGIGLRAALAQPARLAAMLVLLAAAIAGGFAFLPPDTAMTGALSLYTAALTAMTIAALTLPAARWLAMLGALFFFISDGFVALNVFKPLADPQAAQSASTMGWLIYWVGQACLCLGALRLGADKAV